MAHGLKKHPAEIAQTSRSNRYYSCRSLLNALLKCNRVHLMHGLQTISICMHVLQAACDDGKAEALWPL